MEMQINWYSIPDLFYVCKALSIKLIIERKTCAQSWEIYWNSNKWCVVFNKIDECSVPQLHDANVCLVILIYSIVFLTDQLDYGMIDLEAIIVDQLDHAIR